MMRNVKTKMSYNQARALHRALVQYISRRSRHTLESLAIAVATELMVKINRKTEFEFYKEKTFTFSLAEAYTINEVHISIQGLDAHDFAAMNSLTIDIGKQLPK
jgi:hypothetical protein